MFKALLPFSVLVSTVPFAVGGPLFDANLCEPLLTGELPVTLELKVPSDKATLMLLDSLTNEGPFSQLAPSLTPTPSQLISNEPLVLSTTIKAPSDLVEFQSFLRQNKDNLLTVARKDRPKSGETLALETRFLEIAPRFIENAAELPNRESPEYLRADFSSLIAPLLPSDGSHRAPWIESIAPGVASLLEINSAPTELVNSLFDQLIFPRDSTTFRAARLESFVQSLIERLSPPSRPSVRILSADEIRRFETICLEAFRLNWEVLDVNAVTFEQVRYSQWDNILYVDYSIDIDLRWPLPTDMPSKFLNMDVIYVQK